jgi:hypothetical protein
MIIDNQQLHDSDYRPRPVLNQADERPGPSAVGLGTVSGLSADLLHNNNEQHSDECGTMRAKSHIEGSSGMKQILAGAVVATAAAMLTFSACPAGAAIITYDVSLNFNPLATEASPGAGPVGTITGTVTIDTSIPIRDTRISNQTGYQPTDVVGVDLTESTNDGQATIGGAFGSPTYTSFMFNEYQPVTHIFFGSPIVFQTSTAEIGQNNYEFNGNPFMFLFFQTNDSYFDGTLIGPTIKFDFPFPQGGDVAAGNFDSITSETKYLYGSVTTGVPEIPTWAAMLLGFAGLGFAAHRRATPKRGMAFTAA